MIYDLTKPSCFETNDITSSGICEREKKSLYVDVYVRRRVRDFIECRIVVVPHAHSCPTCVYHNNYTVKWVP